ncbi:urokinase plasminogen activator surface receptor-like [Polypterus senegalus]|uniref:urokinase plasminogen activator surface receptor-like n=1 Tax=Polypterus senegalus TaxID=55291 RepID=UPI0019648C29|nr:urokinase plasminogen activator surface receptor-like [Polypterus senegalus]
MSCSSADSLCASGALSYSPGSQTYTRTCVEPTTCNTNGSLNYGYGSVTWIFKCCNTDLCNDDKVSFPNNTNGLYCCAGTDMTCQNTVNCTGMQDSCFTSADGANVYLGCSSATICEDHNLTSLLGLSVTSVISCCEGNLCNQPGNASIPQNALVCCTGSDIHCQNTVTCANTDDFCFIYDDGWSTNTGCASRSQCEASSTPNATMAPSYSCCQGNLCNKPSEYWARE